MSEENNKLAVVYARFSPRPDEDTCDSNIKQLERCRAYCAAHGYRLIGEYRDDAISGAETKNRPGFLAAEALTCYARATLVVAQVDRLTRNVTHAIAASDKIKRAGGNLAFLDMNIDTSTPTGECFFIIIAAFAQMQRKQIAYRTKIACRRHMANGRRIGRFCPYGWKTDPNNHRMMVQDAHEQAMILWIIAEYERLKTVNRVMRSLRIDGIMGRNGPFRRDLIRDILKRNGKYKPFQPGIHRGVQTNATRELLFGEQMRRAEERRLAALQPLPLAVGATESAESPLVEEVPTEPTGEDITE